MKEYTPYWTLVFLIAMGWCMALSLLYVWSKKEVERFIDGTLILLLLVLIWILMGAYLACFWEMQICRR